MNRRSYDAALAASNRRGEGLNGHGWHALAWRTYAELQRGDRFEARRLLAVGMEHQRAAPSAQGHAYLVAMRGQILTHLAAPGEAPELDPFDGASPSVRMRDAYARAAATLLTTNDADAFRESAADFATAYDAEPDPSLMEQAAAAVLRGRLALDADPDSALALMRQGAELEQASPLTFGPPTFAVPPTEAYAFALASTGRYDLAVDAFRQSLARAPGRASSLKLLWLTASRAGMAEVAADAERRIREAGVGFD